MLLTRSIPAEILLCMVTVSLAYHPLSSIINYTFFNMPFKMPLVMKAESRGTLHVDYTVSSAAV